MDDRELVQSALNQVDHDSAAASSALRCSRTSIPRVAGFDLISMLHRGGQGVVYHAVQQSTGRSVAVKLLRQGVHSSPAEMIRLEREIQFLGKLQHPNIVTIHDSGVTDGMPYYVMDYIDGVPLDRYVEDSALDVRATLQLFLKVTEAVQAAHVCGVIHRDLKPANILVDEEGRPFVVDFGLAKTAEDVSSRTGMTETGQFVGSLPWAAPEQFAGDGQPLDVRADVYALGVILYRLLTRQFPYDLAGSPNEVAERIRTALPSSMRAFRRDLDGEIEVITLKCLAKERERRYQSAGELAGDLRRYFRGDPIQARAPSLGYLLSKQFQRHRTAAMAAAAVLLAILLGGASAMVGVIWALQERDRAEEETQRARAARSEAVQRSGELERVAAFQASQLAGIQPSQFGAALRRGVTAQRRAALASSSHDEAALEASLAEWTSALAGLDFTNLGLEALAETVFTSAMTVIERDFADQPLIRAQLLQSLADTLRQLGLYERAGPPQREALAIRRDALGEDHPLTLASRRSLGALRQAQGDFVEAEAHLRAAYVGHRETLGDDHVETLTSLNFVGLLLSAQGKYGECADTYQRALDGRRRLLGEDHPDTVATLHNLATTLHYQGKYPEAERCYQEVLVKRRMLLGSDHPETLTTINSLGLLLKAQGRLTEAEPYYQETLDGRTRVLGTEHPGTLIALNNMGLLFQAQGRFDEAEKYLRASLDAHLRVLGENHPNTLTATNNLGFLFKDQARFGDAEPYLRTALEGRRRVLGDNHPATLGSMTNLGIILFDLGRYELAEPLYMESLRRSRIALGEHHPDTLGSMANLSHLLRAQGRLEEAEESAAAAVAGARASLPASHWNMAVFLSAHAHALMALKRFVEAESALLEALEIFTASLGRNHFRTIQGIENLVGLYETWQAVDPEVEHEASAETWRAALTAAKENAAAEEGD